MSITFTIHCSDGDLEAPIELKKMSTTIKDSIDEEFITESKFLEISVKPYTKEIMEWLIKICKLRDFIPEEDPLYFARNLLSNKETELLKQKDGCKLLQMITLADLLQISTVKMMCMRFLADSTKNKEEDEIRELLCIDKNVPVMSPSQKEHIIKQLTK